MSLGFDHAVEKQLKGAGAVGNRAQREAVVVPLGRVKVLMTTFQLPSVPTAFCQTLPPPTLPLNSAMSISGGQFQALSSHQAGQHPVVPA